MLCSHKYDKLRDKAQLNTRFSVQTNANSDHKHTKAKEPSCRRTNATTLSWYLHVQSSLRGPQGISNLLWLTGRLCSPAVVSYTFSLKKLSPSLCPPLSWHQIFISITLSHCSTSKLVDRLHSYRLMQHKLHESRMMRAAAVIPDCVRQVDTPKILSPPPPNPLPLLWPPVLLVTSRVFVLSVTGTELWEAARVTCWSN